MTAPAPLADALDVLLRYGGLMLRAGNAAFRVRESMGLIAPRLGIEELAVHISVDGMVATARRGAERVTLASDNGPPGIDSWQLSALQSLAHHSDPGLTPAQLAAELDAIVARRPLRPAAIVALAVGIASGAFAYLNGGNVSGILAAFLAGGCGQLVRSALLTLRFNVYAVTALCAIFAGGLYTALAWLLERAGNGPTGAGGFVSAALFMVPGFPLVAALLDVVHHQTVAGMVRMAYGVFLLLAAAFGLCLVAVVLPLHVPAAVPSAGGVAEIALLRAIASFVGAAGFAVLYNSARHIVLAVGVLAMIGNVLRLELHDVGMALPFATYLGALTVGGLAWLVQPRLREPRMVITVPGIIIMVPGAYAFQAIVSFAQGDVTTGLQAAVLAGFVVGAMAFGLTTARFIGARKWRLEG